MRDAVTTLAARWLPARVREALRRAAFHGSARYCPICDGRFRRFLSGGVTRRPDVLCPGCGSLERHRLAALLLARAGLPARGSRVLHIAPEPSMIELLANREGVHHVTADLHASSVDVRLDLIALPHPDSSFDVVYCSHVLEHVEDDRMAMREIARVLRPAGLALIQVPIDERETTFEDADVVTPADRLRVFGQDDHVRIYGRDVRTRLEASGLEVSIVRPEELVPAEELDRMRLMPGERAYLCRRRSA